MAQYDMRDPRNHTPADREYAASLEGYFESSCGDTIDKLRNFTKFVPRQNLALFLAKSELFRRVMGIHGHIVECGVFLGAGVMTWAQLSAIHEPYNYFRRIVGFDTFSGFTGLHAKDATESALSCATVGGLAAPALEDLNRCVSLYDLNRPLGHISRVEFVKGDARSTIPAYLEANQQLVVAMLYLDFDVYEPTKIAIETFLPRMPKGSILAFDELNQSAWPGETLAVLETVGLRNVRVERFPSVPALSFAVLD